ncbi:aldo/keto reductase [Acidomonas methanolica]|uniref:Aldo/keto reductase n=1 Tax=Acidomonas methanolica NBRC 104435 TaxID=1231351 RepID=A0A023D337_ACIMT|nr:aldo/keto reductase [Acidomonas methanolica]MBU2655838.1 aldo/keto reductase [Acidomonas methanolica]MCQ9156300.1 aldo/keto reductase [Acidomonas methanolica]TCS15267.1 aryl-alcohol dehydrogenase-like predicted oxidoreductase [Acidomonas methanolica]GAJ28499.1 aldo/keto reductase [Acidomonas methanolica NBRC 104435]GBQ60950.1 oxidoreductase [Acidomonas methanolica]
MEYRLLGHSGLKVSSLILGTMTFGGQGSFAKVGNTRIEDARRQVDMCLDAGVNMLDTADIYSDGMSEEIVGQVIAGRRDKLLLATKARFPMREKGPNDRGLSRQHLVRACEDSLKRLGTDHIDLYWCHEWDGQTPVEEILRALDDLVRSGKIGYVGVSNFSGWHMMKMLAAAKAEGLVRPVAQQIYYSLQARDAEYELLPIAVDQGIGAVIWSPLAGGLLSGKYRRGKPEPEGTRRAAQWQEPPVRDIEQLYDVVEKLVEIAAAKNVSPAQVALAWLLTRPGVASLVIGARTEAQLDDNLRAAELVLDPGEVAALEDISRPPLLYPYWHQKATASDRLSPADLVIIGPHLD